MLQLWFAKGQACPFFFFFLKGFTRRLGLTSPALWLRWRVRCCRWARRLGGRELWRGSRGSMKVVARQLWSTKKGCVSTHKRKTLKWIHIHTKYKDSIHVKHFLSLDFSNLRRMFPRHSGPWQGCDDTKSSQKNKRNKGTLSFAESKTHFWSKT